MLAAMWAAAGTLAWALVFSGLFTAVSNTTDVTEQHQEHGCPSQNCSGGQKPLFIFMTTTIVFMCLSNP